MKTTDKSDNELIAEFMGYTPHGQWFKNITHHWLSPNKIDIVLENDFDYNESWDWLMPVVEKISKYCYEEFKTNNGYKDVTEYDYAYPRTFAMLNNSGKFMIRINRMCLHEDEILIKATYEAVVEFIKWFNSQSNG